MFKRTKVCAGVLAAMGSGLALVSSPLLAQTTPAAAGERVEITGSRIKSFETESASPVVTIGAEAIKVEGVRNIEQLLNNMPQVFADQGAQVSNGATGAATVNLRNLGSTRNLVLINGRRLPAGSVTDPSADLNQIPLPLLRRVEILTGGASAVYGSDAVAGVINFILNDRFEGFQIDASHQFYNHQQGNQVGDVVKARGFAAPDDKNYDGQSNDISFILGGNFAGGKGNATIFGRYKKEKALLQSERDFSACALNAGASYFTCGGSGTTFPAQITDFFDYGVTPVDAAGNIADYDATTGAYNFGPLNYFRRPSERYNISALGRYDFNDAARFYTELSFHDDRTVAQIAPSGLFFFPATLRFENPFLSPALRSVFNAANQNTRPDDDGVPTRAATTFSAPGDTTLTYIGRRNVEGGGRQDDRRHTSYRAVVGMKGDIDAWSYDASAQIGKVLFQQTYFNDFSNTRIGRALDAVQQSDGTITCQSVVDGTDPACVPYNPFQAGGVTPEALAYVQTPLFSRGETSQFVGIASVSGDLGAYGVKSPLATTGIGVVIGGETRLEKLDYDTDTAFTTGDGAGQGGPTIGIGGSYRVKDIFGELRIPLIEKKPYVELLNLTGSYRRSSYSTDQKTSTYGVGLEYAPVTQIKLRGSYQKAARAANIVELFQAQSVALFDLEADPCAGNNPARSLEECQRTGVTAAQYGSIPQSPAGQYNQIIGGNPNLKPETAKSFTFGLVAQPMRDLTITADYFSIKIEDVISTAPPNSTLGGCLNTGAAGLCSLIQRDAVGSLWLTPSAFIVATNANLAERATSGVDLQFDYGMKIANYGALDFTMIGTRLLKFENTELPGSNAYDCVGYYGDRAAPVCSVPLPKWRHKLRAAWTTPWDIGLAATWRHIGKVNVDLLNAELPDGALAVADYRRELSQRNYLDLQASYNISKNLSVRATVNNVLDKDPPIRTNGAGFTNGNTYPVVYDALGRQVTLSLTATF